MSRWRREASSHLPEFQGLIASKLVDSPMMLWIELNDQFGKLCDQDRPPVEALGRFWKYCDWCLSEGSDDVRTAAALGFCEHLLDTENRARVLPQIMSRADFLGLKSCLTYHNEATEFEAWLTRLWP